MIKIYEPFLADGTLDYAHDALKSTWISSQGEYIKKATDSLNQFLQTENSTLVSNGTVATHSLFRLVKKTFPNIKNIIVPNNVYVAAWNSILLESSDYNLVSVDCDLQTWNYDLQELYDCLGEMPIEATALFVVHNVGNIINVPKIQRDFPDLVIVEDNCEGFTGFYEGRPSGTECFASSISFFANKNLTAGEGGAVITKYAKDSQFIKRFINQGNTQTRFVHDIVAQNYRMTNIHAAILYGQLQKSQQILSLKERVFDYYREILSENEHVVFQQPEANTVRSNWMFGVRLKNGNFKELSSFLQKNEIETRPMFYCYEKHNHLKDIIRPFRNNNNAKKLNNSAIILPSSPTLDRQKIYKISNLINAFFG